MYQNWKVDLSDSCKALEKIKNTELPKLISGKIHSIENSDNEILLLMDVISGIDYIRQNEAGLQGIAARVQFGYNFDTFTIRKTRHTGNKTEFEKRIEQIENGYFYPAFVLGINWAFGKGLPPPAILPGVAVVTLATVVLQKKS